ncbi:MAG: hypothetical protein LBN95_13820 [Prevotellaceae bacterium]|jgi:hypothetical protein|nr:hypothetical protein [Prevotellaceae bacterium]
MRKIFTILCLTLITFLSNGQTVEKNRSVVKVMEGRFTLNSAGNAVYAGGKNTETIKIPLPPNTVEWCYSFRTIDDKNSNIKSNIFDQIMSMDIRLNLANMALKAVAGSKGTCNVFLIDSNKRAYKRQEQYSYGLVPLTEPISNNLSLWFQNENITHKVTIEYEVVAIVETTKNITITNFIEKSDSEKEAENYFKIFLSKNNNDLVEVFLQHQPTLYDCRTVFTDNFYTTAFQNINKMFSELSEQITIQNDRFSNKTVCRATEFNTNDVISNNCNVCPGIMERLVDKFKPNIECYSLEFLENKNSEYGIRYSFFAFINGKWVYFPMN